MTLSMDSLPFEQARQRLIESGLLIEGEIQRRVFENVTQEGDRT